MTLFEIAAALSAADAAMTAVDIPVDQKADALMILGESLAKLAVKPAPRFEVQSEADYLYAHGRHSYE